MSIQGINFTSSLLDKKNVTSVTEESKITTPQNLGEKPDEFVKETDETELQEKPNHKVRNWAIGIGSAVVLIGLTIAGRAGKLGKGIQKFLGGAKKEVEEVAGHSKPRVTETEEEISIEEFERIKNKDTDFVAGGNKKPSETVAEETSVPKQEEKPVAKNEEAPKPKPELTPKQVELNAKLNRVPPKIEPELLHCKFPTPEELYKELGIDMKEIEKIDISKYSKCGDNEIEYVMVLPNKHKLKISRKIDSNEISQIFVNNEKEQRIGRVYRCTDKKESYYGDFDIEINHNDDVIKHWFKKDGTKDYIYYHKDGKQFKYNQEGNLIALEEPANKDTGISRKIEFHTPGKDKVESISYTNTKEYEYLKTDYFDVNGKFTEEYFNSKLSW